MEGEPPSHQTTWNMQTGSETGYCSSERNRGPGAGGTPGTTGQSRAGLPGIPDSAGLLNEFYFKAGRTKVNDHPQVDGHTVFVVYEFKHSGPTVDDMEAVIRNQGPGLDIRSSLGILSAPVRPSARGLACRGRQPGCSKGFKEREARLRAGHDGVSSEEFDGYPLVLVACQMPVCGVDGLGAFVEHGCEDHGVYGGYPQAVAHPCSPR